MSVNSDGSVVLKAGGQVTRTFATKDEYDAWMKETENERWEQFKDNRSRGRSQTEPATAQAATTIVQPVPIVTNPLQADPTNDPSSPWYKVYVIAAEDDLFDLVKDNVVIAKVPSWVASNFNDPTILDFVRHRIDHCINRPFTGRLDAYPRCF